MSLAPVQPFSFEGVEDIDKNSSVRVVMDSMDKLGFVKVWENESPTSYDATRTSRHYLWHHPVTGMIAVGNTSQGGFPSSNRERFDPDMVSMNALVLHYQLNVGWEHKFSPSGSGGFQMANDCSKLAVFENDAINGGYTVLSLLKKLVKHGRLEKNWEETPHRPAEFFYLDSALYAAMPKGRDDWSPEDMTVLRERWQNFLGVIGEPLATCLNASGPDYLSPRLTVGSRWARDSVWDLAEFISSGLRGTHRAKISRADARIVGGLVKWLGGEPALTPALLQDRTSQGVGFLAAMCACQDPEVFAQGMSALLALPDDELLAICHAPDWRGAPGILVIADQISNSQVGLDRLVGTPTALFDRLVERLSPSLSLLGDYDLIDLIIARSPRYSGFDQIDQAWSHLASHAAKHGVAWLDSARQDTPSRLMAMSARFPRSDWWQSVRSCHEAAKLKALSASSPNRIREVGL